MSEKIAVFFCSANTEIDPDFNTMAREAVQAACRKGYVISSGGTTKGTMKVVVDAAKECGGRTLGIIPRFMDIYHHKDLDQTIWTDTMSERKELMRKDTSLCVALPGGVGTLDELMETLTLAKLGKYDGKIVIYNCKGFYNSLRDLLDYLVETGMLDAPSRALAHFVETPAQFEAEL